MMKGVLYDATLDCSAFLLVNVTHVLSNLPPPPKKKNNWLFEGLYLSNHHVFWSLVTSVTGRYCILCTGGTSANT